LWSERRNRQRSQEINLALQARNLTAQLFDGVLGIPPDRKTGNRQHYDKKDFHKDDLRELYSPSGHGSEVRPVFCVCSAGRAAGSPSPIKEALSPDGSHSGSRERPANSRALGLKSAFANLRRSTPAGADLATPKDNVLRPEGRRGKEQFELQGRESG
jgi:hypothetical protein